MSVIFTRAPLRISLGGGGTDLPSYYEDHGGFLVSGAIDKYVYMLTHTVFQKRYRLKYSEIEEVDEDRYVSNQSVTCSMYRPARKDDPVAAVAQDRRQPDALIRRPVSRLRPEHDRQRCLLGHARNLPRGQVVGPADAE